MALLYHRRGKRNRANAAFSKRCYWVYNYKVFSLFSTFRFNLQLLPNLLLSNFLCVTFPINVSFILRFSVQYYVANVARLWKARFYIRTFSFSPVKHIFTLRDDRHDRVLIHFLRKLKFLVYRFFFQKV